mmetsp:Transcript_9152/g.26738  ORF Transcript_9152/g.26738 Transcript_9152/m.26738 type:complete len:205 (+) Transcript_9152:664-1278(+)
MPSVILSLRFLSGLGSSLRSFQRSFVAMGSLMQSVISPRRTRVGSALPPAPMLASTRKPLARHAARSSALVFRSSMQSSTYVGRASSPAAPPGRSQSRSSSSAAAAVNILFTTCTAQVGTRSASASASACTFGRPTSATPAVACRLRLLSVTWSKSTMRMRPTPPRESMCAAWLPTPPTPTTITNAPCKAPKPSGAAGSASSLK